MTYCCKTMQQELEYRCEMHPDPYDCADNVVVKTTHGIGIIIHDGGSSSKLIAYCPWCGTKIDTEDMVQAPVTN